MLLCRLPGRLASLALKKSESKDSIRPRRGKKTAGLFCPPKKIFCKSCDSGKLPRVGEVSGQVPKTDAKSCDSGKLPRVGEVSGQVPKTEAF